MTSSAPGYGLGLSPPPIRRVSTDPRGALRGVAPFGRLSAYHGFVGDPDRIPAEHGVGRAMASHAATGSPEDFSMAMIGPADRAGIRRPMARRRGAA